MPTTTSRIPFHEQAEDLRRFRSFYDAVERVERDERRAAVTGPSENSD
jgi:hypothetical protein